MSDDDAQKSWKEELGDLASDERFSGFNTVKELADAYANAPKPRKLPNSPEEYQLPENVQVKGLRSMAHSHRLSQKQLNGILEFNSGITKKAQENIRKQQEAAIKQLKEEWGDDYDTNLANAKKAVAHFDKDGELAEFLQKTRAGDNPKVLRFMHKLGKTLEEDGFMKGDDNVRKPNKSLAARMFPNHKSQG